MIPLPTGLESLAILLLLMPAFHIVQRGAQRAFLRSIILLTAREDLAVMLFSLFLLPGVLLHEGSHYLSARLLGVRTGRFSILPKRLAGGRLRLGYVEVGATGNLRASLIGAAPLITGILLLAWIGSRLPGLANALAAARSDDWTAFFSSLAALPAGRDFWLWFYLAFCISGTMLPSASDRKPWLSLALVCGLLLVLALLAGAGPWLEQHLLPPVDRGLRAVNRVLLACLLLQGALALLFRFSGLLLGGLLRRQPRP